MPLSLNPHGGRRERTPTVSFDFHTCTMAQVHLCGCCGLYMLSLGSGTIRGCGLVGIGVALLEKVFHVVGGLGNLLLTD